jgi:actin-like ATPase involved in cell morphogenesis
MNSQLAASGRSGLALRRFARPCWSEDRATVANAAFRDMLAKGQVIGDTIHDSWTSGVPVKMARRILDQARALQDYPMQIVDREVLEATAAAGGALRNATGESLFLVVDVGAGTCDCGVFFAVAGRRIAEVSGTTQVLRQAGDRIDEFLLLSLLEAAHVGPNSDEASRIRPSLRLRIRDHKEMLFLNGVVSVTLENDAIAEINLSQFRNRPDMKAFCVAFENMVRQALAAPPKGTYQRTQGIVDVVLTGGGAALPMILEIFSKPLNLDPHGVLRFRLRNAAPEWLVDYPDILPNFPQLAVAIGGAQPDLPTQSRSVTDIVPPESGRRFIPSIYKS